LVLLESGDRRNASKTPVSRLCQPKPGTRRRITWISFDCPAVGRDRVPVPFQGARPLELPSLEIFRIRLGAAAAPLLGNPALPRQQLDLERSDYGAGDLILHCKDLGDVAIKGLGPEMEAVRDLDQLRGDTHPRARGPNASLEDVGHRELSADLAKVIPAALERERRGAPRNLQPLELGERVENL